jgi:hypothetical protein
MYLLYFNYNILDWNIIFYNAYGNSLVESLSPKIMIIWQLFISFTSFNEQTPLNKSSVQLKNNLK